MRRALATVLLILTGLILGLVRRLEPGASGNRPQPRLERPAPPISQPAPGGPAAAARGGLTPLGDPNLDAQIHAVVAALDTTGRPPEGVAQGGRKRGARGVFDNLEGRLPRRASGYYAESDVWPRGSAGRGAQRLVLGREGEVYYSADHYRTFTRLR